MSKKYNTLIALTLIVFLAIVSVITVFHDPSGAPAMSMASLFDGTYMQEFEEYARDNYVWQSGAKTLRANTEYLLGKKGDNGVHFSGGYLIARPGTYNQEIVEKNLEAAIALKETGKYNVSVAVVPTAFEVLQDRLPTHSYDDRAAKVIDRVNESGDVIAVCDTRSILESHKEDYIYYRNDSHLTGEGSYYVYNTLGYTLWYDPYSQEDFDREIMSEKFRGDTWAKVPTRFTKADVIERYVLPGSMDQSLEYPLEGRHSEGIYDEDYLDGEDKYSVFPGSDEAVTVINSNCGEDRRLAVIKDSYANSIAPFLANHFESVHLIDLSKYKENIVKYLDDFGITDVLILYSTEGFNTDTSLTKLMSY